MKLKVQSSKLKTNSNIKYQNPKHRFYYLLFITGASLVILLSGCSTITEMAKGFLGTSTQALEEGRKNAIRQSFKYDYETCFNKTIKILKELKAYIYLEDKKKHLLAIYVSEEDTTCVGIFFREIDAHNTEIEVSSPSTAAKEYIATQLFANLIMAEHPK